MKRIWQCRPWSDSAKQDIWSGSTLYGFNTGISVITRHHSHYQLAKKVESTKCVNGLNIDRQKIHNLFAVLINPLARGNVAQQNPWIIPPSVLENGNSSHSGELSCSEWPIPLSSVLRRSFFRSTEACNLCTNDVSSQRKISNDNPKQQ